MIREHILQFLTGPSLPMRYPLQEDALFVLFRIAGATFGTYTDPSVVDHCFELLKGHDFSDCDVCWHQLKVGKLYKEGLIRLRQVAGGGNSTTGVWLGGSASPTCIHNK